MNSKFSRSTIRSGGYLSFRLASAIATGASELEPRRLNQTLTIPQLAKTLSEFFVHVIVAQADLETYPFCVHNP